jgi:hypothetical protein
VLDEACQAYQDFLMANLDEGVQEKVVENLRFLIHYGDVTTYQWKYGEKPLSVEQPEVVFADEEKSATTITDEIDFGGDNEIDFGDDGLVPPVIDGGDDDVIDFGDDGTDAIDFGDSGTEEVIDFDIENVDTSAIVIEAGGLAGGVAKEEEALTLLDNRRTRALLLDELEELAGFLSQRLVETESTGNKFSLSGAGSQQLQDADTLRQMLHNVEKIRYDVVLTFFRQLYTGIVEDRIIGCLFHEEWDTTEYRE